MLTLGIEAEKDVVFVGCPQEKPCQVQPTLPKIGFRFECLKIFVVLKRYYNDRGPGIDMSVGKSLVKDGAHPLELIGNVACALFAGVTKDDEMRSANLQPTLRLGGCNHGNDGDQKGE